MEKLHEKTGTRHNKERYQAREEFRELQPKTHLPGRTKVRARKNRKSAVKTTTAIEM